MAKINGIVLLHKRYTTADWANHVLQAGELGLDLTTKEVRIGTASDQAWANASPVSCKVVVTGEGKHITSVTYENGVVTVTKGTISYDDLANKPALNFDAAGTAASAVSAHNSAADAHADIRQLVSDNATAISTEAGRAAGEEQRIEGLVTAEAARAAKAEGDLQTAVNAKVAQADYDTKVAALEKADTDLDAAVKAEAKTRGEEITRVEGLINTEKGRIDTLENTTIPTINAKIGTVADNTNLAQLIANETSRASGVENGLKGRLDTLENTTIPDINTAHNTLANRVTALDQASTGRVALAESEINTLKTKTGIANLTGDDTLHGLITAEAGRAAGEEAAIRGEFAEADAALGSEFNAKLTWGSF